MRKLILTSAAAAIGLSVAGSAAAQTFVYYPPGAVVPAYPSYDEYGQPYYEGAYAAVPSDEFGPDPNGMIASDGHRIKCKLQDRYDYRLDRYLTRRVCD